MDQYNLRKQTSNEEICSNDKNDMTANRIFRSCNSDTHTLISQVKVGTSDLVGRVLNPLQYG